MVNCGFILSKRLRGNLDRKSDKDIILREVIWITTKLWINDYESGNTEQSIDNRLKLLKTDYIDLLLIHQQHGKYMEAWREMEKAVKAGIRSDMPIRDF